uniref:Uncharacterized protein n=1 Tax=Parascaris univalens TaxID=6257 RepID=A0A915C0E3_PARUN
MATMRHPSWPRSRERSPNLRITTLSYSTSKNSGMSCSMKSNAMSRKPQGIMAQRKLSSHRFARIRRSYLGDLGALHTVEGSIVNFVRKVEKNFPKNANIEVLRKDIEVAEAELAKLEAKAVTYLELLNEMSEEDMLGQIAECEQQMENARQWFRDRGLMDKFNSIDQAKH